MSIGFENFLSGMNATLLWENPNPNASFGEQDVTLLNPIYDYDFIYIDFKIDAILNLGTMGGIVDLNNTQKSSNNNNLIIGFIGQNSLGIGRDLYISNVDKSTKIIHFNVGRRFGGEAVSNNYLIPLKIYGLKGKVLGVRGGVILKLLKHLTRKWGV